MGTEDEGTGSAPVPAVRSGALRRGFSSRSLARAIFDAEVPEEVIRGIPAQSIFLAVKQNGLSSSADLISITTPEQCAVLLDLDLWEEDRFNEETFWEWLSLADEEDNIAILQKVFRIIDLKLIGLIISRHVETKIFDEATERPPGIGYFTPDNGYTWIFLTIEDATRHFYLGRLLALAFETNADLFYQLLALPNVSTPSMLEEEAFQDRERRLAAQDIPDRELAARLNSPTSAADFLARLGREELPDQPGTTSVEPLLYDSEIPQPLGSTLAALPRDEMESSLSLILNSAVIHFGVPFSEYEQVVHLTSKVKGALNIGLETALGLANIPADAIVRRCGLDSVYRLGLSVLFDLRKLAFKVDLKAAERTVHDSVAFSALAGAREKLPEIPRFFKESGEPAYEVMSEMQEGVLQPGFKAFETVSELNRIRDYLRSRFEI